MTRKTIRVDLVFLVSLGISISGLSVLAFAGTEEVLRFRFALKNDPSPKIEGFSAFVRGRGMDYFSHLSPSSSGRIVRAGNADNVVEWKTAAVPADFKGDRISFIWVAGVCTNKGIFHFHLAVDGKERFAFSTRPESTWTVKGTDGGELSFASMAQDFYHDQFGYMKMTVPAGWLKPGKPLTLRMTSENNNSDAWVMVFNYPDALSTIGPIDEDVLHTIQVQDFIMTAVDVTSLRQDWVGKTVSLVSGTNLLGEATLAKEGDLVKTTIQISPRLLMDNRETFSLVVDGKTVETFKSKNCDKERLLAFLDEELDYCPIFSPGNFPQITWKRPGMVAAEMGRFDLKTTYYDANYNRVEKADKPGRYGAVVEAVLPDGYHFIRYITLFCAKEHNNWPVADYRVHLDRPDWVDISESAWKARQKTMDCDLSDVISYSYPGVTKEMATLLAGAWDLGDKPVKYEYAANPLFQDRQWWVTFKRRQTGVENKYSPLKQPATDTTKTTVLHEGDPATVGYRKEQIEAIRQVCRDWVKEAKEPLSVLVARKGVIVLQESFGEYPDGRKLTLDTPTWMASITKLMTGCVMMQFVDQGLINLDDPVSKYLPEFAWKDVKTPLTIRHLFTHTSGYWGHGTWGGDWSNSFENAAAEYLPYLEVNRKYEYNGAGYSLAAKVMERVSGKAWPFLMQEQLFVPLGDEHTSVQDTAGSMCSTCMDMAKVAQMLLNGGSYGETRFFNEKTFQKMLPTKLNTQQQSAVEEWGIGIQWFDCDGVTNRTLGHGAHSGAVFRIDPKNELLIISCRNKTGVNYIGNLTKFMQACTAPFNAPATSKGK